MVLDPLMETNEKHICCTFPIVKSKIIETFEKFIKRSTLKIIKQITQINYCTIKIKQRSPHDIWMFIACKGDDGFKIYNAEPTLTITSHTNDTPVAIGSVQKFVAELSDANHDLGDLTAYWMLNDQIICPELPPDAGGASVCNATLPEGAEKVTIIVTDPQNGTGIDEVLFNIVENQAPTIEYLSPRADGNANFHSDQEINFSIIASDDEDPFDLSLSLIGLVMSMKNYIYLVILQKMDIGNQVVI